MLILALAMAPASPCTAAQTARSAIVFHAIRPSARKADLKEIAPGFSAPGLQTIAWTGACGPRIMGFQGPALVTGDGKAFVLDGDRLTVLNREPRRRDVEPPRPAWKRRQFVASQSLYHGDWRIGAWAQPDGTFVLARYQTGRTDPPIPLMVSAVPVLDLRYLPSPDSTGGNLSILQRLGRSSYRIVSTNWTEEGLRTSEGR